MVQIILTNMYVTKHSFAKRFVKKSNHMLLSSHTYMTWDQFWFEGLVRVTAPMLTCTTAKELLNSCDFEGDSTDAKRELVLMK